MRKAELEFSSAERLSAFIIRNPASQADVHTQSHRVTAFLSDQELVTACTEFGAIINVMEGSLLEDHPFKLKTYVPD